MTGRVDIRAFEKTEKKVKIEVTGPNIFSTIKKKKIKLQEV